MTFFRPNVKAFCDTCDTTFAKTAVSREDLAREMREVGWYVEDVTEFTVIRCPRCDAKVAPSVGELAPPRTTARHRAWGGATPLTIAAAVIVLLLAAGCASQSKTAAPHAVAATAAAPVDGQAVSPAWAYQNAYASFTCKDGTTLNYTEQGWWKAHGQWHSVPHFVPKMDADPIMSCLRPA